MSMRTLLVSFPLARFLQKQEAPIVFAGACPALGQCGRCATRTIAEELRLQ